MHDWLKNLNLRKWPTANIALGLLFLDGAANRNGEPRDSSFRFCFFLAFGEYLHRYTSDRRLRLTDYLWMLVAIAG